MARRPPNARRWMSGPGDQRSRGFAKDGRAQVKTTKKRRPEAAFSIRRRSALLQLARERIELAPQALLARPLALQVRVVGVVLLEHALGIVGQRLLAQPGVAGGHEGHGVAVVF